MGIETLQLSTPQVLPLGVAVVLTLLGCASASLETNSERADQRPLILDQSRSETVSMLGEAFQSQKDWKVKFLRPDVGQAELVHYTKVFRFPDDIEVHTEKHRDGGVVLHARSTSRYGLIDFGQNARNLRELSRIVRAYCTEQDIDCRPLTG